jgi:hypothetical protein
VPSISPIRDRSAKLNRVSLKPKRNPAELLHQLTKRHPSEVEFSRLNDSNYIYGTLKVTLTANGDRLMIKCNGDSMFFEEFVEKYEFQELEKKKKELFAKHFSTDSLEPYH